MQSKKFLPALAFGALLALCGPAKAGISYQAVDLTDGGGADRWKYIYQVDSPIDANERFVLFFDPSAYADILVAVALPSPWNQTFVPLSPSDGELTSHWADGGQPAPIPIPLFEVEFDWLGTNDPQSQPYELRDKDGVLLLSMGTTPAGVPEPATLYLVLAGLMLSLFGRKMGHRPPLRT